jgi:hypothetical protein
MQQQNPAYSVRALSRDLQLSVSYVSGLITGLTFAGNPANFERAQRHLHQALYESAEILTAGPCTEVYQLNAQLFLLTSSKG